MWEWFDKMEKRNPGLPGVVMKTFIEQLNGTKAFKAVMSSASSLRQTALSETNSSGAIKKSLVEDLERTHPLLKDYHVILIKKNQGPDGD